jgi:hypothetical protein
MSYGRVHPHGESAGAHLSEERGATCAGVGNNKLFALTIVGTSHQHQGNSGMQDAV